MANSTVYPFGTNGELPSSIGIVNDLVTGGADKALSAEQGVVLQEEVSVLDYDSQTETVSERIPYVQHIGYIATYNQIIAQTTGNNRYSDPIFLKAGEALKINAITASNVGRIASYNPDTEAVTVLLTGQSTGDTYPTDMYENTYTATSDIYVIVGWNYKGPLELTKTYDKTTTTSRLDELDAVEGVLDLQTDTETKTEELQLAIVTGEYLSGTNAGNPCDRTSGTAYNASQDFAVLRGDIINISTSNAPNTITILAYNDGVKYRSIIRGDGSANQTGTFTAPYDMLLAVSYRAQDGMTVTRARTSTMGKSERLDDMDDALGQLSPIPSEVTAIKNDIYAAVSEDITTGTVDGKFITHSGQISENAAYSYKEFPVRAGAVVVFTATMNPSLCAIAKKLSSTTYEELVPGETYTEETFNYTATEDMTMAVSFNNIQSRHITIDTKLVESNHISIVNLRNQLAEDEQSTTVQDIDFGFMFNKIAVIGDSLASGRVEGIVGDPDAAGADYYGFSWLTFLAKRWRCEKQMNYSGAGLTTATWISNWLSVLQNDTTVYDAYFIALGTNNEYNETNPSGDETNYEAFIDRYNDIIDAVRAKAQHAAIFIMSLYEKRAGYGNATLQGIAETRALTDDGVFYLDYADEAEYLRYSPEVNWRGHFSSDGYAYVASAINQIVNRIVWTNKTEEFWVQFAKYHNENPD